MYKTRVLEALQAIKNGEMVIIMDDEGRENEGDLVFAGIFSTPEKINFLAKEARGLICVCIQKDLSIKLDLPYMVDVNSSNHETAFTVSIDAKKARTGISVFERDLTIKLMCDENSTKDDFVRPGHIFPLIAKDGGVLERTGHTEASIDLCKLAGIKPVAVICELMKEDGSMPGNGDSFINDFAKKHNLKVVFVSDLVQYRMLNENLVKLYEKTDSIFLESNCKKYIFSDYMGHLHTVFQIKDNTIPLIKFHKIKNDLDLFEDNKHFGELLNSFSLIKKEGGFIVFLNSNSCTDDELYHKGFGIGAQILASLNISSFRLITNNNSTFIALKGFNLNLLEYINIDSKLNF